VPDHSFTIGALAERTGVAPSALRYYEQLGLMPRAARVSGKRRYDQAAVAAVGMILILRDVGCSLAEIRALMRARARSPAAWRELVGDKVVEIDERMARAQVARVALEHALRCTHDALGSCPNFARVLGARIDGKPLAEAHPH
jgi:DNA-binding transcriptional MerR regulator